MAVTLAPTSYATSAPKIPKERVHRVTLPQGGCPWRQLSILISLFSNYLF